MSRNKKRDQVNEDRGAAQVLGCRCEDKETRIKKRNTAKVMNKRKRERSASRQKWNENRRRKSASLSKDRLLEVTEWESVSLPLLCPSLSLCNALLKSD